MSDWPHANYTPWFRVREVPSWGNSHIGADTKDAQSDLPPLGIRDNAVPAEWEPFCSQIREA